jgi:hypothetical protein
MIAVPICVHEWFRLDTLQTETKLAQYDDRWEAYFE